MSGYAKLLSSIVTSTIWREDSDVCKVWVTLLALANRNGEVESSIPGLAAICGISVPAVENALQVFQKPDKYSRSKEFEGRRISEINGGWLVLNYLKHRGYMSKEDRQEKDRIRQQRHRDINKTNDVICCDIDNNVTRDESRESRHAESREQIAEAEAKTFYAERFQLPLNDGTFFPVTDSQIAKWTLLYPAVDVEQAIRSMIGWSESNPTKRKTSRGIQRFVNSWLDKEQNRSHSERNNGNGKKQSSFSRLFGSDETTNR